MQSNPETLLASTAEVVNELTDLGSDIENRTTSIVLSKGEAEQMELAGINLEILYISHGDPELLNLGFIINLQDVRLFHTGDLVADAVSVADLIVYGLPQKRLDVAFVPLYMFQSSQYHGHIREGIRA